MARYKEQLLRGFADRGWDQVEVNPDGVGWWAVEHWRLRSVRRAFGAEIFVTLLVDPQFEGPGEKKAAAVWAVIATSTLPQERPLDDGLALLPLHQGRFDANVVDFLDDVDQWRQRVDAVQQEAAD